MSFDRMVQVPEDRPEVLPVFAGLIPEFPPELAPDEQWAPIALGLRQALETLSPVTESRCLLGEDHDCGGSHQEHAFGYMAALCGWSLAQLGHWKLTGWGIESTSTIAAQRIVDIDQQLGHDHSADVAKFCETLAYKMREGR